MFRIVLPEKYLRKKFFCISVVMLILYPDASSGKNYEVEIKSGISREIIDYEDESDKLIFRGGTGLKLFESFFFDLTTVRNIDDEVSSYTWNLVLKDISGCMDFTAGNYNLHFGSGLMMGKKSYSSGDPFSKKISIAKDKTVSPSTSGNPEYSLYGAAFDFHKTFDDMMIYLIPFFSIQRRFVSYESIENGEIDSSLFSLNSKTVKSGNYTEPVNIINYGAVCGLQTSTLLNIQMYYFETDLKSASGDDILWDKDKYYARDGIDLIRNSGAFAEYADRNISIFIEPAVSSIKNGSTVTDFGMAWGIGIRNSIMNYSLKGKNCGVNFHSEYSSRSRTPERIWESKCAIYPFKFLETGLIIYSEKDMAPGYNKDYIEGSIQEEVFTAINTGIIDINFNLKRREHYSTDREDTIDHGTASASCSPSERLYFKIRSSVQKSSDEISYLSGGDMKFLFSDYFGLSVGYSRIIVNGEVPFYAMITPASEHSSITCFRESAHGGSMNLRYKKEKDSFYVRFTVIKADSGTEGDIESALVLFF